MSKTWKDSKSFKKNKEKNRSFKMTPYEKKKDEYEEYTHRQ